MKLFTLALVVLLSLTASCSYLDAIKSTLSPDSGLSVDAQIGDRDNDLTLGTGARGAGDIQVKKGNVNVTTSQSEVEQAENVEINQAASWWVIILLILGWVLPTPMSLWKGIKEGRKDVE